MDIWGRTVNVDCIVAYHNLASYNFPSVHKVLRGDYNRATYIRKEALKKIINNINHINQDGRSFKDMRIKNCI